MPVEKQSRIARKLTTYHRWLVVQGALLAVCLITLVVATAQVHQYDAGVSRQAFVLAGSVPLPAVRYTSTRGSLNVLAVVVHGYSANKEMMSTFGVDLAKQGVTTYTYDLPGHGASTVPYGGSPHLNLVGQLVTSVGEVVDYALAHAPAPHPKLVLIGYSLGTIAVGEYALRHPELSSLTATVLVAGILHAHPTVTNPPNLLVLSGQFDLPGINDISRDLIASGCAVPPASVRSTFLCDPTGVTGHRERIILQGLDHISIVTAHSTHTAVLRWLHADVDTRIGAVPVDADVRLHWMLLGFAAASLATFPLLALGAAALGLVPQRSRVETRHGSALGGGTVTGRRLAVWQGAVLLGGTLTLALVLLHVVLPTSYWALPLLAFLAQQVSADVATFLLIAGLLLIAASWGLPALRRQAVDDLKGRPLVQIALAGLIASCLYLTLGGLSTYAWEGLTLYPARLWRAGMYVLLLWPYLFGVQVLIGATARRWWSHVLADLLSTLLLIAAFIAAIATNFARLSYLGILLPVFVVVLFWFVGFNAWARRILGSSNLFVATTEALVLAWALAATLPLVG